MSFFNFRVPFASKTFVSNDWQSKFKYSTFTKIAYDDCFIVCRVGTVSNIKEHKHKNQPSLLVYFLAEELK